MGVGEESQEEPEPSAENAEVSGAKPGGGKMSQTQLEQVKYIRLFNRLFSVISMNRFVLGCVSVIVVEGKIFYLRTL